MHPILTAIAASPRRPPSSASASTAAAATQLRPVPRATVTMSPPNASSLSGIV